MIEINNPLKNQLKDNQDLLQETYLILKDFYRNSELELPEIEELLAKIKSTREYNEVFLREN